MAHRTTIYAQKIRDELIEKLGGKCALCPECDPAKLQFDHIHGRDYNPNNLSYSARLARYKREAQQDKLRLLCEPCNLKERKRHENGSHCRTNETPIRTMEMPEIVEVEL
jgi:5-methylcytosine-specific restriction endonuclease McrA